MSATNIYSNDFLDILFDGRNKEYGAYDLRRSQDSRLRNAIIGTASLALVVIGGYVVSSKLMAADMRHSDHVFDGTTVLTDIKYVEPPVTPPPPVHASTPPPAASSISFTTPKITSEDVVESEVPPIEEIGNKTVGLKTIQGDDINGVDAPDILERGTTTGVVQPPKAVEHSDPPTFVEKMPSFPGGDEALSRFLQKNMRYPQMAVESTIEGRVYVQFIVDWQGNISGIKTVGNHIGAGLEEEAMRVVKLMPKWNPGRQNGQAVNVQFNLPVAFRLQ